MPSSALRAKAFEIIAPRAAAFSSALALTASELRAWLADHGGATGARDSRATTFGAFAAGRIDPGRLAHLVVPERPRDAAWSQPVERALGVLEELLARGDDLFCVRVPSGDNLAVAVENALADAGRAFGAARLASLARSSHHRPGEHDPLIKRFPFGRWSTAERKVAPPLLIEVEGGDAVVAGLGAYLDGDQAFVLIVSGDAPPAPLARLVSPGVLVVQTGADDETFAQAAGFTGPMVVAIMPPASARFVHLPVTGRGHGALEVSHLPAREPTRPVGAVSAFQQQQDLHILSALAVPGAAQAAPSVALTAPKAAPPRLNGHGNGSLPVAENPPVDLVGALATWLLARVDLSDLEAGEQP